MEKKKIEVHAVTIHIYTIIIAALVVVLAFVSLKYLHLKFAVHGFTEGTIINNIMQQKPTGEISDYGVIVATTIANYPKEKPLWNDPVALESYVTSLSAQLDRDIVVIDSSRKVLADTMVANVGTNYAYDMNHEIDATVKDGHPHTFVEKSADYKEGIEETVVSVKDASGKTVGVVLISNTTLSK